jgi:hypothetical protein
MAGIAAMAIADTATARIGPTAMELLAAKSAGARCGAQGMFAVSGCIETPNALRGGGLRVAPPFDFPSLLRSSDSRRENCLGRSSHFLDNIAFLASKIERQYHG